MKYAILAFLLVPLFLIGSKPINWQSDRANSEAFLAILKLDKGYSTEFLTLAKAAGESTWSIDIQSLDKKINILSFENALLKGDGTPKIRKILVLKAKSLFPGEELEAMISRMKYYMDAVIY